jgi:site-specific recombinase XerC
MNAIKKECAPAKLDNSEKPEKGTQAYYDALENKKICARLNQAYQRKREEILEQLVQIKEINLKYFDEDLLRTAERENHKSGML